MSRTKIEWVDRTWSPVTGCTAVSEGCDNCWARRMAQRLRGRYGYPKDDPFEVTEHRDRLDEPARWRKPSKVFVCSMGDLFHPYVRDEFRYQVFVQMARAKKHIFLLLTKRVKAMLEYMAENVGLEDDWLRTKGGHIWVGASVENQRTADFRIPILLQIPAKVRFVSIEPMLGPVNLHRFFSCPQFGEPPDGGVGGLDWVILGGETGPGARPMHPDWVRSVRDQCQKAGVPFFFKQFGEWIPKRLYWPKTAKAIKGWGTLDIEGNWFPQTTPWNGREGEDSESREYVMYKVGRKAAGRYLDGRLWEEWPE